MHTRLSRRLAGSITARFINDVSKPYAVTTYARPDLVLARGKGSYLYDLEDREYIDFFAGIAVTALGHLNPAISDIMSKQSLTLVHGLNLFYNMPAGELANKLVRKTLDSGGMKDAQRVFLCNSGTEANEAALKFARRHGRSIAEDKTEIICFRNGFHGRTYGALSVTANEKYQAPFAPMVPGVRVCDVDIGSVEAAIGPQTAGVIVEPIQGEGGVNVVPELFLVLLRKLCSEHRAVLIFDEIQCGLGRTGQLWAHCGLAAHPDIVTMAKALGNGFPIGATMISESVEKTLKVGDHGTTYGGNPLACAVGNYVVDQVSDPEFLEEVQKKGALLKAGLEKIAADCSHVESIKGSGLLLGVALRPTLEAAAVVEKCREYGLLVITAGNNTVRLVPALNIPTEVLKKGIDVLARAFKDVKA